MKPRLTWLIASASVLCPFVAAAALEYTPINGGLMNQAMTIDGLNASGLTGGIKLTPGSNNDPGYTTTFTSVCLDVYGELVLNTKQNFAAVSFPNVSLVGLNPAWGNNGDLTAANGFRGSSSSAQAGGALNNAAYLMYSSGSILTSGSATQRAAFQMAIWEVLYDTGLGFDLDNGRFQGGDATVKAAAENLLASLFPANSVIPQFSGKILVPLTKSGAWDPSKQELLIDPGSITPVPEASTVLAGFAGVAMLLTGAWRAYQRKSEASKTV